MAQRRDSRDDLTFLGAQVQVPALLDEPALCKWLRISPSHLDRLLAEGLPALEVGFPAKDRRTRHERRFLPRQVIQFLVRRSSSTK